MFSDSCSGQNKSKFIIGLLYVLANHFGIEIVQLFLVSGHSYMPADADFGKISQVMRKHIEAFELRQYEGIIKVALTDANVVKMEREQFLDIQEVIIYL